MVINLLKSERVKHGLTQKELAEILDIDPTSYSKKENGLVDFKASEIAALINTLDLSPKQTMSIFFSYKLESNSS